MQMWVQSPSVPEESADEADRSWQRHVQPGFGNDTAGAFAIPVPRSEKEGVEEGADEQGEETARTERQLDDRDLQTGIAIGSRVCLDDRWGEQKKKSPDERYP